MRTRAKVAVLFLLAVAACLPARAGWAKDAATKDEEDKASEAFYNGRYEEARGIYARLRIKNKNEPIYLRNLGRCADKLGDLDGAIDLYNQYLQAATDIAPTERAEVEGYIKNLQDKKADQRAQKEREQREREQKDREQPAPVPPPNNVAPPPPPPPPPGPQPTPVPPAPAPAATDSGAVLRLTGLGAAGLGVVSIGLAAYFGAQARDAAHEIEGKAVAGSSYDATLKAIDDRGRGDETKEWIFLGAGAGLLVGGGVLYYLGARSPESGAPPAGSSTPSATALLPAISPRLVGAAVQGRF